MFAVTGVTLTPILYYVVLYNINVMITTKKHFKSIPHTFQWYWNVHKSGFKKSPLLSWNYWKMVQRFIVCMELSYIILENVNL